MKTPTQLGILTLACLQVLGMPPGLADTVTANTRYVQVPAAPLWKEPSMQGTPSEYLPVGDKVELVESPRKGSPYCHVRQGYTNGYVACQDIGEEPAQFYEKANIDIINLQIKNDPEFNPGKFFNINPGAITLWNIGLYYELKFQDDLSDRDPKAPWKPLHAPHSTEFDIMKAKLASGLLTGRKPPELVQWKILTSIYNTDSKLSLHLAYLRYYSTIADYYLDSAYPEQYAYRLLFNEDNLFIFGGTPHPFRDINFNNPKPSLFNKELQLGRPNATTEELSGQFDIPFSATIQPGDIMNDVYGGGGEVHGSFGMQSITSRLKRPLFKYTVYVGGTIKREEDLAIYKVAYKIDPTVRTLATRYFYTAYPKNATHAENSAGELILGPSDNPSEAGTLFTFYSDTLFDFAKADITRTTMSHRANYAPNEEQKSILLSVDFDHDGIPEFLYWQPESMRYWLLLANIGGTWRVLAHGDDRYRQDVYFGPTRPYHRSPPPPPFYR